MQGSSFHLDFFPDYYESCLACSFDIVAVLVLALLYAKTPRVSQLPGSGAHVLRSAFSTRCFLVVLVSKISLATV